MLINQHHSFRKTTSIIDILSLSNNSIAISTRRRIWWFKSRKDTLVALVKYSAQIRAYAHSFPDLELSTTNNTNHTCHKVLSAVLVLQTISNRLSVENFEVSSLTIFGFTNHVPRLYLCEQNVGMMIHRRKKYIFVASEAS